MKKKIWFTAILASVLLFTSCVKIIQSSGKGKTVTKNVRVHPFHRIKLETVCHVHFQQGDTVSVRIVGDEQGVNRLKTTSDGTTLTIEQTKRDRWTRIGDLDDVDVYITSPDLTAVLMRGAGDFEVDKHLDTDTLSVRLEGAGDIDVDDLICDEVSLELKGTGDIELKKVIASGVKVNLKGVGDINLHIEKGDWVQCELEGVGDITLSGVVRKFRHRVKGTGSVDTDNLRILSTE